MESQHWPYNAYQSHASQPNQSLQPIPEEREPSINAQLSSIINEISDQVDDDALAKHLNSMALDQRTSFTQSSFNRGVPSSTSAQMATDSKAESRNSLTSRYNRSIEDKAVRAKILDLYRECVHSLGTPHQQTDFLSRINSGTAQTHRDDYIILSEIMSGWLDMIASEVLRTFHIKTWVHTIWIALVEMGALNTTQGFCEVYWNLAGGSEELDGLMGGMEF